MKRSPTLLGNRHPLLSPLPIVSTNLLVNTMKDIKEAFDSKFHEKGKQQLQTDNIIRYTEKFSLVLPSIGISVVNSHPQELVYACASDGVWNWRQNQQKKSSPTRKRWNDPSAQPLLQTNLEFPSEEEAEELMSVLLSAIETGKCRSWHSQFVLNRSNIS